MKVSIIIPIYNASKYLVRCLDSVFTQTFQDIECIMVDDCGKDDSVAIAERYIQNHQGSISFNLIHHKINRGAAAARNTGIEVSKGEFLYFLDSDDALVPETIETLLQLFEKYPDIEFAQGNVLSEDGSVSPYGLKKHFPEYSNNHEELQRIMLCEITTAPWNRLIRRDFVLEHNLYFPEGYFTEDMYWGYFISKFLKAAAFTQKGLYIYYINEGSMMTSPANHIKWYTSRIWTSWQYIEDMEKYGSNKYKRQYLAVNLLSCLPELKKMNSTKLWFHFWKEACSMAWALKSHTTLYRCYFLLCLLPPICLYAASNMFRWRIQRKIITKL